MIAEPPSIFVGRPASIAAYSTLMQVVGALGPHTVEEKKTCLHLVGGKSAFLGVHPRKEGLRLSIVLTRPLEGERIRKCEQLSANRYHAEVDLREGQPIDDELRSWIRESYERTFR